jgi:hypothetical protein
MRVVHAAIGLVLALAHLAHAADKPPASQRGPARQSSLPPLSKPGAKSAPPPPLPMLPRVGRVRVEAARDRVVVIEEVKLPRGEWQSGPLSLYVAFGEPGTPIAVDSRLVALAPDVSESRLEDAGEPVLVEPALRRPPSAQLLFGRAQMAGVVVRVKDTQLRHAYATSELAVLRVRSLLSPPSVSATGARDVVVRLGVAAGVPLTVERVEIASLEVATPIARAEANLCGADADPWPLSVAVLPKSASRSAGSRSPTIAPEMAVRHASDDLCVRWWVSP